MAGDIVSLGRVSDVADVQVPCEKEIRTHRSQLCHRHSRSTDEVLGRISLRQIERMVSHDHLDQTGGNRPQPLDGRINLRSTQPPAASGDERTRAIEAQDGDLVVDV